MIFKDGILYIKNDYTISNVNLAQIIKKHIEELDNPYILGKFHDNLKIFSHVVYKIKTKASIKMPMIALKVNKVYFIEELNNYFKINKPSEREVLNIDDTVDYEEFIRYLERKDEFEKNIVFVQPRKNKNETVYRVIIKYNDENNDYKVKEVTYRPLNKSASTKTKENEAYNYGLKVLEDTLAEIEKKKQINNGLAFKDIAYRWLDSKFDKNNPLSDRNCSFRYYEICKKAIIFLANYFDDIIIKDITRLNINDCFKAIDNITREVRYAYPKKDFVEVMKNNGYSNSVLRRNLNLSSKQVYNAFHGIPIDEEKGHIIAETYKINYDDLFVTKIEKIDMGDNTKARYKKTLRAIMNYAHNTLGVISDNPMAGNKIIMKKPKEKKAISDEGLLLMFEKCNEFEPRVKLAIRIALTTGMRPEELGGLEWKDIDVNTGKISIKRAVVYVKGFGNVIKETKTGNDRDSVDVQFLLDNIKEYQKWQTELISKLGDCVYFG